MTEDRVSKDAYFINMAKLVATRGTCARRKVGCVLVNELGHVMATGYNGVPKGHAHCIDNPCPGANLASGCGLDACEAVHAEINALIQCQDTFKIHTAYVTASPCVQCIKALCNTSLKRIVFEEEYPNSQTAKEWWLRDPSREWVTLLK